ncbi:MAG: hypothetical protein HOP28_15825 [Gemmatimonadales bacterium]|nr:hypothetical protein [Gemmatimonadales bacterium]
MDLSDGFRIDEPPVMVPWSVSENELGHLFGPVLRHVTAKYWTARVRVLGGLECNLGFHFRGNRGQLSELEFFRDSYDDQAESFTGFQRHFEAAFGAPTETQPGTEGFPSYRWLVPGAEIIHLIVDRFGPEEHMRIRRSGAA